VAFLGLLMRQDSGMFIGLYGRHYWNHLWVLAYRHGRRFICIGVDKNAFLFNSLSPSNSLAKSNGNLERKKGALETTIRNVEARRKQLK